MQSVQPATEADLFAAFAEPERAWAEDEHFDLVPGEVRFGPTADLRALAEPYLPLVRAALEPILADRGLLPSDPVASVLDDPDLADRLLEAAETAVAHGYTGGPDNSPPGGPDIPPGGLGDLDLFAASDGRELGDADPGAGLGGAAEDLSFAVRRPEHGAVPTCPPGTHRELVGPGDLDDVGGELDLPGFIQEYICVDDPPSVWREDCLDWPQVAEALDRLDDFASVRSFPEVAFDRPYRDALTDSISSASRSQLYTCAKGGRGLLAQNKPSSRTIALYPALAEGFTAATLASERALRSSILLHEHVHRVEHIDFRTANERIALTPRRNGELLDCSATEYRAAYLQAKYLGVDDCLAELWGAAYARSYDKQAGDRDLADPQQAPTIEGRPLPDPPIHVVRPDDEPTRSPSYCIPQVSFATQVLEVLAKLFGCAGDDLPLDVAIALALGPVIGDATFVRALGKVVGTGLATLLFDWVFSTRRA